MPTKVLFNGTPYPVQVTLYVRAGLNPGRVHSSIQLKLAPGDEVPVEFGDLVNRSLEGLELDWVQDGARHMQRRLVTSRDSPWESTLNRSEALLICSLNEVDVRPGIVDQESTMHNEIEEALREIAAAPIRDQPRPREEREPRSVPPRERRGWFR